MDSGDPVKFNAADAGPGGGPPYSTDEMELRLRRLIDSEIAGYRTHLETLTATTKSAMAIIVAVGGVVLTFLVGKTYLDANNIIQQRVSTEMVAFGVKEKADQVVIGSVTTAVQSTQAQQLIQDAVQAKVRATLGSETERRLNDAINAKVSQLNTATLSGRFDQIPLGTIVASLLPPDVFARTVGDSTTFDAAHNRWTLSDGRSVTGSTYSLSTGSAIAADLRGMFLRGMNGERRDGNQDPMVDRAVGGFQADGVGSHAHRIGTGSTDVINNQMTNTSSRMPSFFRDGFANERVLEVQPSGGAETRPKNIAVFFYLKIN